MDALRNLITKCDSFKTLKSDFCKDHFSHAYLATNPDSLFLKEFLLFAAALAVCPEGGCLECIYCSRALKAVHADILIYPREKDTVLSNEIEDIIVSSFVLPMESKIKAYIINDFDKIQPYLQNKLLKTIEEPSQNTVFFLGATNESKILDTIKSRCQKINIDQIVYDDVVAYLEEKGIQKIDAQKAAAISFLQPLKAESFVKDAGIFQMFEDVINAVKSLSSSRESLQCISILSKYKNNYQLLLQMMMIVFREALSMQNKQRLLLPESKKNDIISVADKFSQTALTFSLDLISEAKTKLENFCNFNVVIDELVLSILEVKHRCPK